MATQHSKKISIVRAQSDVDAGWPCFGNWRGALIVAFLTVIFGLQTHPSRASAIDPNCTVAKAWAADLRSYIPVSGKKPVPRSAFFDREGNERTIADYRGTGVVLNFWATWCPPCVREMPALDRMRAALAGSGIDVVAVSEDIKGVEHVAKYYKKLELKHLELFIDRDNAFMRAANVGSLPTTLLIDEEGNEVAGVLKDAEWDSPAIIEFVKSCLTPRKH